MAFEGQFIAAAQGNVQWLRQCLRKTNIKYNRNGLSLLHIAAIHGHLNCLKFLIEEHHCNINLLSCNGFTPLHVAINNSSIRKNSIACVNYLLERGADISISSKYGSTPLHKAAQENHVKIIKILLKLGAKLDCKDNNGLTPLDVAKVWANKDCGRILTVAMWHRNKKYIAEQMDKLSLMKYQMTSSQGKYDQNSSSNDLRMDVLEINKIEKQQSEIKPSKKSSKKINKNSKLNTKKMPNMPASSKWNYRRSGKKEMFQTYIPNLTDEYPRDPYTQMPKVAGANKYYDGKHKNRSEIPDRLLKYLDKKVDFPDLPNKVITMALSKDPSIHQRPIVFKSKNVLDVQTKLRPNINEHLKPEINLHLCNDNSSCTVLNALQPNTKMLLVESLGEKIIKALQKKKSKTCL